MRVMVILKANADSEAGVMPSTEVLNEMGRFNAELVNPGVMLAGEGLTSSAQGKRVRFSGKKSTVIDGPFATKELVSGFWIWQVASMDEALEWITRSPFVDAEVELRRVVEIEDFKLTPEMQAREQALRDYAAERAVWGRHRVGSCAGGAVQWSRLLVGLAAVDVDLVAALLCGTLLAPLQLPYNAAGGGSLPKRFWFYAVAVFLYGIVETLCGNWATLYLSGQRHVSGQDAAYALTGFWVMVTVGRVVIAFIDRFIATRWIYVTLPVLLAIAFQIVAAAHDATTGIAAFAVAGLACSAFLPFSISFAGTEFPHQAATMSGLLLAVYQVGYGVAAFGVGPIREHAGISYSTVFALGSIVALTLAFAALLLIRAPARVTK